MAVLAEERAARPTLVELLPVADPAPLGLAGFALTTFMLSGHNASFIPDVLWIGLAFAYGGLAQLLAGMWEFRNRNVFGATAFSTYGGFWIGLGLWALLVAPAAGAKAGKDVAWILLAFAIFNTYMLFWSTMVNAAVFGVFLTLELTEIILFIGNFAGNTGIVKFGGYVGIVTALVAWYTSAAAVACCFFGIAGILALAGRARQALQPVAGSAHASVVRYSMVLAGAIFTLVIALALFKVPVGQLIVGGALTTILIGIAAQQSLSNVFAGLVLLLSRPFNVGETIQLRSGAMGGLLEGTVTEIGISYLRLGTADGLMSLPNSQVLAAAVSHRTKPAASPPVQAGPGEAANSHQPAPAGGTPTEAPGAAPDGQQALPPV